ncbi:MAG: J domain-containing protein [Proteobacteria bacterium]|nr:J domain-containing protein [Pseudomonadota bacterium]
MRDSISKDIDGVYKEKWMEFAAHLKKIEKKGVQTSQNYPALDKQLNHLQKLIIEVSKNRNKSDDGAKEKGTSRKSRGQYQENEKSSDRDQNQKKTDNNRNQRAKLRSRDTPDYYKILGVTERSSRAEVKRAFHKKMQQYHPDKHNSSDFDWIKKEATKMSQLVQEAYEILDDPSKRRRYNENHRT